MTGSRYGRNLMRKVISILSRPVAYCRKQWLSNISLQFILGILIGILLGFCAFNYDNESFTAVKKSVSINQQKQLTSQKYIQALRDTYTKQCNHTVYITNSKEIRRNFTEELNIAFVNTKKTQFHWDLYRQAIKFSTEYSQKRNSFWTVISDAQTFIVMANLRKILLSFNASQQSLILGRIFSIRNLLSYLFPWNIHKKILPEAGVVFSRTALEAMANDGCFGWLSARATERALIQCSNLMNVQLIDPVDEEGKHLFIPNGLQELIADSKSKFSKDMNGSFALYSDEAVSFGNLNYRLHRVLDFTITRIKMTLMVTLHVLSNILLKLMEFVEINDDDTFATLNQSLLFSLVFPFFTTVVTPIVTIKVREVINYEAFPSSDY